MIKVLYQIFRNRFAFFHLSIRRKKNISVSNLNVIFLGEFGYEIVSLHPFLNSLGLSKINYYGRNGINDFYPEILLKKVDQEFFGTGWGEYQDYLRVIRKYRLSRSETFFITNTDINYNRKISVNGKFFRNIDIHAVFDTTNYVSPLSSLPKYPRLIKEKYVVINNKSHYNWGYTLLRNFFVQKEVDQLKAKLEKLGFLVVYNDPNLILPKDNDSVYEDNCVTLDDKIISSINLRGKKSLNQVQISLWQNAEFVIGVHGGSCYPSAFLNKKSYFLMRKGNYMDFCQLRVLTGNDVDIFYEVSHLISYIDN